MALSSPRRGNGIYEPVADINVTPLVDVMLVLLIVFMITAPLLAAGMRVELPQAKSAQPLDPKEPVIVTVAKDGKIYLGHDEIAAVDLPLAIRARLGDDRTRAIHLRGDHEVVYGEIVAVMDRLAQNGLTKIALIANAQREPRSADSPASLTDPTIR
jgi:biopolymer transport protein ExbD/biopolymer transport protein TolR